MSVPRPRLPSVPPQGVANVAEAVKEAGGKQRVVLVSSCLVRWAGIALIQRHWLRPPRMPTLTRAGSPCTQLVGVT